MSAIWNMSKALRIPLDKKLTKLDEVPYTISFVIRKRQQIDSFNELPKEKRPDDKLIWEGTAEEIEDWFDRVFDRKKRGNANDTVYIDIDEVE